MSFKTFVFFLSVPEILKLQQTKDLITLTFIVWEITKNMLLYKSYKLFNFDSIGSQPDEFLLQQIPNPIPFQNHKFQDLYSRLCGTYCLYFFCLIERID